MSFFAPGCLGGDEFVPVIRHREHHGVNVIARHHFTEVMIGPAILVPVMVVDRCSPRLADAVRVKVTGGDHLAVILDQKMTLVLLAPACPSQQCPS